MAVFVIEEGAIVWRGIGFEPPTFLFAKECLTGCSSAKRNDRVNF